MDLKPGVQLASVACDARIVVVKVPADQGPLLACGGQPLVPLGEEGSSKVPLDPSLSDGVLIGKRYEADGVEVLCTASGGGTLTSDGVVMTVKTAKPLPASD